MKRHSHDISSHTDWKCCCICGEGENLRSTDDGIRSLAEQFVAYWKNEILPFSYSRITTAFVVGEDGISHPDFFTAMQSNKAQYHHNCQIRFTAYKMGRALESMKKKKSKSPKVSEEQGPSLRCSTSRMSTAVEKHMCIICGEFDELSNLLAAGAFHASKNKLNVDHVTKLTEQWREMAVLIGDNALASRLMIGDLGANSSFYHKRCSTKLYNRVAKKQSDNEIGGFDVNQIRAAAWDKVIAFMTESPQSEAEKGFNLHELEQIYLEYLARYDVVISGHVTRFGKELIERAPHFEIVKNIDTRVYFKESVRELFNTFLQSSRSWIDSIRAVIQPIREDIFKRKNSFCGTLNESSQVDCVSPFLLSLMSMLIDGEVNLEGKCSQAVLTVAGLVTHNARKLRKPTGQLLNRRHHKKERETPISIYTGLKLYSTVRSRSIIDQLFNLGICISYPRILSITKSLYESLRITFATHGLFLPAHLKQGCFVVLVKDNIDKNAAANLIKSHYHGTSISLLQFPDCEGDGEELQSHEFVDATYNLKKLCPLPAEYTCPTKVYRPSEAFFAPLCTYNFEDIVSFDELEKARTKEHEWAFTFSTLADNCKAWAQYHSSESDASKHVCEGINSLLPLLRDKVNTLQMQCHTMKLNTKAVKALNPDQTPVDVSDCPVFALTKEAIYRFPEQFTNYFAMFGGLHIEQCLLVTHGQLLENSGLKEILEACSLATIGVGAVVDVNQIKRARYCLEVVLCALYRKLADAVRKEGSDLEPLHWLKERSSSSEMCHYLSLVINLEIDILVFIRSIREGNFCLYVQSLRSLLKWFFALDHYNYSRWLTVHVFDLISLPTTFPDLYQQMLKGSFSFAKTKRPFSRMALDQVHEQNNKVIKGQGGATSFLNLQDDSALIRWETCGPEVARIVSEFEEQMKANDSSNSASDLSHHEDTEHFRIDFCNDVHSLYKAIPCNPFEHYALCSMNNSLSFPPSVSLGLKELLTTGEEQVKTFIEERLLTQKVSINATISKNNFPLLKREQQIKRCNEVNLGAPFMNKLRSAVVHRPVQAEEFFKGELYGVAHCFSDDGSHKMYHGSKSSILERLQSSLPPPVLDQSGNNVIIMEASPLLRKLSNASVANFDEFSVVFYNHAVLLVRDCNRLDIVFDQYFSDSLKAQTRTGRGEAGTRVLNINDDTPFPSNFLSSFLCNSQNKNDLSLYLAPKLISIHQEYGRSQLQLCVSYKDTFLSLPPVDDAHFPISSTAEEADQKFVRHVLHCMKSGFSYIEGHSIDTDVLIQLAAYIAKEFGLEVISACTIFFKLVTPDPTWYNLAVLIEQLGVDICKALPCFYALTGCDTVSSFNGKGKCTFFDSWMKSQMKDKITETFIKLSYLPESLEIEDIQAVESLVKSVYYGNSKHIQDRSLNELRRDQFIQSSSNDIRKIAPSSDALQMQLLRAIHNAGFEWVECLHNVAKPNPTIRGYTLEDDVYVPQWLASPSIFNLETFVNVCKCKTAKCTSCKCARLKLPCLPMCHCSRRCGRE